VTPRLTRSERTVLDFIRDYINLHGISPTYEEIARGVGKKSKGHIAALVYSLSDKGAIKLAYGIEKGRNRGISIIGPTSHEVVLPDDLDAFVRRIACEAKVSPAAVIVEAIRDAAQNTRSVSLTHETPAPASATVTPPTGAALEAAE
jgi:repressor LexA